MYLVRVELGILLAQPGQERLGLPAQSLRGCEKVSAPHVEPDPPRRAGGELARGRTRNRSRVALVRVHLSLSLSRAVSQSAQTGPSDLIRSILHVGVYEQLFPVALKPRKSASYI